MSSEPTQFFSHTVTNNLIHQFRRFLYEYSYVSNKASDDQNQLHAFARQKKNIELGLPLAWKHSFHDVWPGLADSSELKPVEYTRQYRRQYIRVDSRPVEIDNLRKIARAAAEIEWSHYKWMATTSDGYRGGWELRRMLSITTGRYFFLVAYSRHTEPTVYDTLSFLLVGYRNCSSNKYINV